MTPTAANDPSYVDPNELTWEEVSAYGLQPASIDELSAEILSFPAASPR